MCGFIAGETEVHWKSRNTISSTNRWIHVVEITQGVSRPKKWNFTEDHLHGGSLLVHKPPIMILFSCTHYRVGVERRRWNSGPGSINTPVQGCARMQNNGNK
jgi:hypothetical protein